MPIVYKTCGEAGAIPEYMCDACSEGEDGRVSGIAFVHKSLLVDMTKANLSMISWWANQIDAQKAFVIPGVRGTYDGGEKNTSPGFGRQSERVTGKTHTVVFNDQNHKGNSEFYEYLEKNSKDYIPVFVTENELRPAAKPCDSFGAKDPVEEDVKTKVTWQNTVVWIQSNPMIVTVIDISGKPDIKELFDNCIDSAEGSGGSGGDYIDPNA